MHNANAAAATSSLSGSRRVIPPQDKLRKLVKEWDEDGDGLISFPEFIRALKTLNIFTTKKDALALFAMVDNDNSGQISYEELLQVISCLVVCIYVHTQTHIASEESTHRSAVDRAHLFLSSLRAPFNRPSSN